MGYIVHNGRKLGLSRPPHKNPPPKTKHMASRRSLSVRLSPNRVIGIDKSGPVAARVEADLAVVREHFDTSISEALRISLHLTANAIRKNRATPEVP